MKAMILTNMPCNALQSKAYHQRNRKGKKIGRREGGERMKIFTSHKTAGIPGFSFKYAGFFFFSFSFANMKLSFLHTKANSSFQLVKMTFYSSISSCFKLIYYLPKQTLRESVCISWKMNDSLPLLF